MKKAFQALLQRILGFESYLVCFSLFKIYTLRWDSPRKEGDFNFFLKLLKPDDHVLDIGANIGIMSALMGRRCPQGRVYAFEPVPENCRAFRRVMKALKLYQVQLYEMALGEKNDTVEIQMPILKGVRMQGLAHVRHASIEGYQTDYRQYVVAQRVLDQLPDLQAVRVGAIKMDVENYEQFVLAGAKELLLRDRPIIYCELWDNENRQACFTMLQAIDYEIMVLDQKKLRPFVPSQDRHHNFFFLPTQD